MMASQIAFSLSRPACALAGPLRQLFVSPIIQAVGANLSSFKAEYLDSAVAYMLGTLYNGGILHRSDHVLQTNGMTVRTGLIPALVRGNAGLTFYWGS